MRRGLNFAGIAFLLGGGLWLASLTAPEIDRPAARRVPHAAGNAALPPRSSVPGVPDDGFRLTHKPTAAAPAADAGKEETVSIATTVSSAVPTSRREKLITGDGSVITRALSNEGDRGAITVTQEIVRRDGSTASEETHVAADGATTSKWFTRDTAGFTSRREIGPDGSSTGFDGNAMGDGQSFGHDAAPPHRRSPVLPVALADAAAEPANLTPEQVTAAEAVQEQFIAEIGGESADPHSPDYYRKWQRAQPVADWRLRAMIGAQAFAAWQAEAYLQEKANAAAP